jgi:hypothetical protein
MKKIKRIAPKSFAKVLGTLYAAVGLIGGAIFSLVSITGALSGQGNGFFFGVGAIVILPILYGAMGFIGGYISALLYNFVAKKVGGIEIELE